MTIAYHSALTDLANADDRSATWWAAGDRTHIPPVTGEREVLAAAEGRYRERSRAVFWDSLIRDIGGE